MIRPTVGRVVLFHPAIGSMTPSGPVEDFQTLAAIIAAVHSDDLVTLAAFDRHGNAFNAEHVLLSHDLGEDEVMGGMEYCEWMPYQKGQAAKTEQAIQALPSVEELVTAVLARLTPAPLPDYPIDAPVSTPTNSDQEEQKP